MPRCKYCHSEISKFDTDICPHCGERSPIDNDYRTMDITQHIDPQTGDFKLYKSKSKKTTVLLAAFLGTFGADSFYLGFKNRAVFSLLSTLLLVAGAGSALYFLHLAPIWVYAVVYGVLWVVYLIKAMFLGKNDSLKDARGEFLR